MRMEERPEAVEGVPGQRGRPTSAHTGGAMEGRAWERSKFDRENQPPVGRSPNAVPSSSKYGRISVKDTHGISTKKSVGKRGASVLNILGTI